jgi:PhnB protein
MALHPYLFFGGNCREAFTRYQEIFGGELVLLPMKDMPSEEAVPAAQADLIMHAALRLDGHLLMTSDDPYDRQLRPGAGDDGQLRSRQMSPMPSGCSRRWRTAER